MKKLALSLFSLMFLVLIGCSSDMPTQSGNNNPFGGGLGTGGNGGGGFGGGGQTGSVTYTVELSQDQQGYFFVCKPSVDVKVSTIQVTQQQSNINETLNNPNPDQIVKAGQFITINIGAELLQSGQQWRFVFTGTLANGGQTYSATATCTIP